MKLWSGCIFMEHSVDSTFSVGSRVPCSALFVYVSTTFLRTARINNHHRPTKLLPCNVHSMPAGTASFHTHALLQNVLPICSVTQLGPSQLSGPPWRRLTFLLIGFIGVGAQWIFLPENYVRKIIKMPEFYTIIGRKNFPEFLEARGPWAPRTCPLPSVFYAPGSVVRGIVSCLCVRHTVRTCQSSLLEMPLSIYEMSHTVEHDLMICWIHKTQWKHNFNVIKTHNKVTQPLFVF